MQWNPRLAVVRWYKAQQVLPPTDPFFRPFTLHFSLLKLILSTFLALFHVNHRVFSAKRNFSIPKSAALVDSSVSTYDDPGIVSHMWRDILLTGAIIDMGPSSCTTLRQHWGLWCCGIWSVVGFCQVGGLKMRFL